MSHVKPHYCLRHPIYAVYIDQRPLYALSLYVRAVCHILFACPCVCPCIPAHVPACMHVEMQHKVLVRAAGKHKARPPIPLFLFPEGGGDKTVCLSGCSQQEGGWGPGWEVMEVVGWGQSSRIYWLDVSVGGLKKGTVTSGILMLI